MRQKLVKVLFYGTWLIRFSFLTTFFIIVTLPLRFSKKYKDLWIIGERPEEARDNGYWLYKWILENKPETNVRFVLKKSSVDYGKMPRKDLIIEPGSAKHYIYWILSSYSVSTHMHGACPGKSFCIPFLPFARKKETVFLQHGIVKDTLKLRSCLDVIIASSEDEKKLILKGNPHYEENIFITGLCRYDNLVSRRQDQRVLLIMPTFRKWLRDIGRLKNPREEFIKTEYYKRWNSFLNSDELKEVLETNDMRAIFFPHNEMQALVQNIECHNSRISIGKPGEYDTQKLLIESDILVTDYSSVFFDFIYMKKPVIFYQFDQEDFFSRHYRSPGKPYPFGDIFFNEKEVIDEIKRTIGRGYEVKEKYLKDAEDFYKYHDRNNCERVYNLIVRKKK